MKITFNPTELAWLREVSQRMIKVSQEHEDNAFLRYAHRLKYKFTPNSLYVNLTDKERQLMARAASYQFEKLAASTRFTPAMDEELQLCRSILTKLGVKE